MILSKTFSANTTQIGGYTLSSFFGDFFRTFEVAFGVDLRHVRGRVTQYQLCRLQSKISTYLRCRRVTQLIRMPMRNPMLLANERYAMLVTATVIMLSQHTLRLWFLAADLRRLHLRFSTQPQLFETLILRTNRRKKEIVCIRFRLGDIRFQNRSRLRTDQNVPRLATPRRFVISFPIDPWRSASIHFR